MTISLVPAIPAPLNGPRLLYAPSAYMSIHSAVPRLPRVQRAGQFPSSVVHSLVCRLKCSTRPYLNHYLNFFLKTTGAYDTFTSAATGVRDLNPR